MVLGYVWVMECNYVFYYVLIGVGVMVVGIIGIGVWFNGLLFLILVFGYVKLLGFEEFELVIVMGFDLGVFLCVLGVVMLVLNLLLCIVCVVGGMVND